MRVPLGVVLMFSVTIVSTTNAQTNDVNPSLNGRVISHNSPEIFENDRKLAEIQIPEIEFDRVPLRKAISELRQKIYEFDTSDPDARKRGINIVVKLDETNINRPVSAHLKKGSLRSALDDLAAAAKLKIKVEPYAVVFVPLSEQTEPLVTKEYPSPGDVFLSMEKTEESRFISAKEILASHGIEFPNGASATVLSSGKLIVRNTAANLKAIEELMDRQAVKSGN